MPHWHFVCLAPPAPFEGGAQILLVGPVVIPFKDMSKIIICPTLIHPQIDCSLQ